KAGNRPAIPRGKAGSGRIASRDASDIDRTAMDGCGFPAAQNRTQRQVGLRGPWNQVGPWVLRQATGGAPSGSGAGAGSFGKTGGTSTACQDDPAEALRPLGPTRGLIVRWTEWR